MYCITSTRSQGLVDVHTASRCIPPSPKLCVYCIWSCGFYPTPRMREAGIMWSGLSVLTQNCESQQVPDYVDWKATVASIIEIHRCYGSRKQPEAAIQPAKVGFSARLKGLWLHGDPLPQSATVKGRCEGCMPCTEDLDSYRQDQ